MRMLKTVPMALALLLASGCMIEGSQIVNDNREAYEPDPVFPYVPTTPAESVKRVVLLHTNDEHSHLLGFSPNSVYPFRTHDAAGTINPAQVLTEIATGNDTQTVGGVARRQYLVNTIRETITDPVLLLSAGDSVMGTMFHNAFTSGSPDYVAMSLLGYDFMTIGNHDFDFGPDSLASALRVADETTFGGAVPVVASNIHFDHDGDGNVLTDLENLYGGGNSGAPIMPYATKVLHNGIKVGFIGGLGYDAQLSSPALGAVSFSVPTDGAACMVSDDCEGVERCTRGACVNPLDVAGHLTAIAADVQPWVTELRETEQVDLVVMLSHLGDDEDRFLASSVSGIDVIIGGHSHDTVEPEVVGTTIIAQAGDYGRKLGKMVVTLTPQEEGGYLIGMDSTNSEILDVDWRLDAAIIEGTDLLANPPVISPAFERALGLTTAIIAPVVAGLNAQLGPALGGATIFDTAAASTYDVLGEEFTDEGGYVASDTPLFHLVTDAEWGSVVTGACLNPSPLSGGKWVVSIQGAGVLRESIIFSEETAGPGTVTIADLFRVLPLGASPFEANSLPGYPLVMFDLAPGDLFAALDIGVTKGFDSEAFFLSYSGMKVSYDTRWDAFDPETFDPGSTDPGGRVTKIEMGTDVSGYVTVYEYDNAVPWIGRWNTAYLNPLAGETVTVITNLYAAGYLDAFGLTPLDPADGEPYDPVLALGSAAVLGQTILCQIAPPAALDCGSGIPIMGPCAKTGVAASGRTCEATGTFVGGTVACLEPACVWDYSGCIPPTCGDDAIEANEQCDGVNLNSLDCAALGFTGGDLACDATTCQFDTSACTGAPCGNTTVDTGEDCDSGDVNGATCDSIGQDFDAGTLACNDATCEFDVSGCTGGPVCGDGVIEFGEQCDGDEFGGVECNLLDYGFSGGDIACTDDCQLDVSGCNRNLCGNIMVDQGEECDPGLEAKEWAVLLNFIANAWGGMLPTSPDVYAAENFDSRVIDVTP